jgi:hypothetical protein
MARPPKLPGEKMDVFIRVPVTSAQKAAIDRAAKSNPSGTAAWARAVLLEAAKSKKETPDAREASGA